MKKINTPTLDLIKMILVFFVSLTQIVDSQTTTATDSSLTLEQALGLLPKSPDWQMADLNLLSAQRNLEQSQAAASLQANAGGNYAYSPANGTGVNTDVSSLVFSANASVAVLPWSSVFDAIRKAQRAYQRAKLDQNETRNALTLGAITKYFAARNAAQDFVLAQKNQNQSEALLKIAEAQKKAGQISQENVLTAQANVQTTQANALQAQNILQLNRLILFQALGTEFNMAELVTAPQELTMPNSNLEVLLADAFKNRNDVLKATSNLEDAQDALANAQRDRLLPNATVAVGYNNGNGNSGISTNLNFLTGLLGFSGSYPIYASTTQSTNWGANFSASISLPILAPNADARIEAAQTTVTLARSALDASKRNAELDVRAKRNDAVVAAAQLAVQKATLNTASQALETANAKNKSGLNTIHDLEQAKINVLQAQRNLENAQAAQQIAVYKLQIAVGFSFPITKP